MADNKGDTMAENEGDKDAENKGDCVSVGAVANNTLLACKRMCSVVGDLMTGGLLIKQIPPLPYGSAIAGDESLPTEIKPMAVQERSLLFTETFNVQDFQEPYCQVKGGKLRILGKGRMYIYLKDVWVGTIVTQTREEDSSHYYDVFRGDTEDDKIGHIQKTMHPDGKDFFFEFIATSGSGDDSKTPPEAAYKLEGDFLARRFVMRNPKKEAVAKVTKRLIAFAAFDHYVIRVAAGMDPLLVIACMVVIDEELDAELKSAILAAPGIVLSFINPFD